MDLEIIILIKVRERKTNTVYVESQNDTNELT